jgi:hypothetical protein
MPSYDDDWECTDFTNDDTEDDCDDEYEWYDIDYDGSDNIPDDSYSHGDGIPIYQPKWKLVSIEGEQYMVSDNGCMKKPDTLFEVHYGIEESGTPFRKVTFPCGKTYYMHDIVWQAFNGIPPHGWEVRHTDAETSQRKRYYSNALRHLTIMPSFVVVRPKQIFT